MSRNDKKAVGTYIYMYITVTLLIVFWENEISKALYAEIYT